MKNIKIDCRLELIGDCLAAMPFFYELSKEHKVVVGPAVNQWVREGIDFPLEFSSNIKNPDYSAWAIKALSYSNSKENKKNKKRLHMSQCHFAYNGLRPPCLPLSIPFKKEKNDVGQGVVFAPFSVSDIRGNKFWEFENWIELSKRFSNPIYVLGAETDDFSWTRNTNITPVKGRSLAFVSSFLRECKLLVSIDTGISHLANLLNLKNHALIAGDCYCSNYIINPCGDFIKKLPARLSVDDVYKMSKDRLIL